MFTLWMINISNEVLFILHLFKEFLNGARCVIEWVSIYEYRLTVLSLLFRGKWTFNIFFSIVFQQNKTKT